MNYNYPVMILTHFFTVLTWLGKCYTLFGDQY